MLDLRHLPFYFVCALVIFLVSLPCYAVISSSWPGVTPYVCQGLSLVAAIVLILCLAGAIVLFGLLIWWVQARAEKRRPPSHSDESYGPGQQPGVCRHTVQGNLSLEFLAQEPETWRNILRMRREQAKREHPWTWWLRF